MSYCINPFCEQREHCDEAEHCSACGTSLLINKRIRLIQPLRPLDYNPYRHTEVFEVEDLGTKWNPVRSRRIMKVLRGYDPKLIELIQREALALQVIRHPGVPDSTIDDYFVFTPASNQLELHCLIMQKFEGENLSTWLEKYGGKISQKQALNWLTQLVEILDTVHRHTFFHRDIKPENIMVQDNGQLALVDFGGARQITDTFLLKVSTNGGTSTGIGSERKYQTTIIGTPGYSPLEQINGQAVPQSDFYTLGRTFVYLVTGIPVIELKTDELTGRLIWRHLASQIDSPLADLLDDLMAPFPGQRPQNTSAILHRLKRLPIQSSFQRIVKSNSFKISAVILSLLGIFSGYNLSRPLIANYFLSQGKKAQLEGRFVDAQKSLTTGIQIDKKATYLVSSFYFEQASRHASEPEVAKKYYSLAIKFNPSDVDAYNNLALTCQQLRDFKCVTTNYEQALKLKPSNWQGHYGLGSFYDSQQEYDSARKQYQLAIQKSGAALAINNLSRLENRSGNYSAAEKLALQGLQKSSDPILQAALYKNLGWAKLEQKYYTIASTYLQKAIQLDQQKTDAYCLLAQTQEKLGATSDAKLSWETCLILNSTLPEVRKWRQQVLQRIL